MRPSSSLIVFLIVLHLLLCRAYGARLGIFGIKSPTSTVQQIDLENNNNSNNDITAKEGANKDDLGREKIEVVCEDEDHCPSKGDNRKLFTMTTVSTSIAKTIQEKLENGANKVDMRRGIDDHNNISSAIHRSSRINDEQQKVTPHKHEDSIDMTQMDYSPAKRRHPIHN